MFVCSTGFKDATRLYTYCRDAVDPQSAKTAQLGCCVVGTLRQSGGFSRVPTVSDEGSDRTRLLLVLHRLPPAASTRIPGHCPATGTAGATEGLEGS